MEWTNPLVSDSETIISAKVNGRTVEVYENDSWGDLYLCGMEYGPTHLIRADSFESAYEAWIDELAPIPADEVHEAYGFWDASELDAWNRAMSGDATADDIALLAIVLERGEVSVNGRTPESVEDIPDDAYPDLLEGYQYQSNATDSGIVDVGHYEWCREVEPSDELWLVLHDEDDDDDESTFVRSNVLA